MRGHVSTLPYPHPRGSVTARLAYNTIARGHYSLIGRYWPRGTPSHHNRQQYDDKFFHGKFPLSMLPVNFVAYSVSITNFETLANNFCFLFIHRKFPLYFQFVMPVMNQGKLHLLHNKSLTLAFANGGGSSAPGTQKVISGCL